MSKADPQERMALALLWVMPALWAVNYVVARLAPGVVAPHQLALVRWGLAGLVLLLLARTDLWKHRHQVRHVFWQYLVLGALGMLICGACVYLGAQTTSAMNIALIYTASPVLIAVGAVVFLGDRLSPQQVLGVLLSLVGVMHVVVRGHWLSLSDVHWLAGDAWIVLAVVSWALYALLQKKWPSRDLRGGRAVPVALCLVGGGLARHAGLELARHGPGCHGRIAARTWRLLDVWLVSKSAGRQPGRGGAIPGPALCWAGGLGGVGRALRLASPGRRRADPARCAAGDPSAGSDNAHQRRVIIKAEPDSVASSLCWLLSAR